MKVLLTPLPVTSHIYNMVPLAWALRAAGHQVRVAVRPNATDTVVQAGLPAVEYGVPYDTASLIARTKFAEVPIPAVAFAGQLSDADVLDRLRGDRAIGGIAPEADGQADDQTLADLVEITRKWQPDLVVWDMCVFAGPVAARAVGAAHVRMLIGLDLMGWMRSRTVRAQAEQPPSEVGDPLAAWFTGKLARLGATFDEEVVVGQATIDPMPSWMRLPVELKYIPLRFVPYNGPTRVPGWLDEKPTRPRVCVSLGLSRRFLPSEGLMAEDRRLVETVLRGAAGLDVEVVATLSNEDAAAMTGLPDNVRIYDFVPLDELLPTCSAIIHHGGTTTEETATVHGVPHLILPGPFWDEQRKAELYASRGAGLGLAPDGVTEDVVRTQLARLLDEPSFAVNASIIRDEVAATPGPHDVVARLEQLCAQHARI